MNAGKALKLSLLLASTMTIMAGAIIAPSLPRISIVFAHVPHIELLSRLVLTFPALFIMLFSSLAGYSIDRFGRRSMLLGSLFLYAIAGTSGAYLNNLYLILIGRALLGITVAGNMITLTTLIGDYFKGDDRSRFMGYQGSFMAFGGVFFIIIAGWLADISWELPFWIYSFSIVVLVLCFFFVPEPPRSKLTSVPTPIIIDISKRLQVWFVMLMGFGGMTLFYIIPAQAPFLLAGIEGVSNSMIGYAISASTLAGSGIAYFYGWFRKRISFQGLYSIAFAFFAAGFIIISLSHIYILALFGLVISGVGTGFLFPNANLWMMQLAPETKRGQLIGNLNMAVFFGQFVSPILVHPIVEHHGVYAIFHYTGFLMLVISVAFAVYHWFIRKGKSY